MRQDRAGAMFNDRIEAGRRLANELNRLRGARPVVLALPRGGLPVGFEIAAALEAPLDVVFVRKIGVPWQPELALGAVSDGGEAELIVDKQLQTLLQIPDDYVEQARARQLVEIVRRRHAYLKGHPPVDVDDRTAIVVDDGIATGATMRVALRSVRRRKPRRLVLAVPVAPADSLDALRPEADEVVCLEVPDNMGAVGCYYRDFRQVSDAEVIELLDRARRAPPAGSSTGPERAS